MLKIEYKEKDSVHTFYHVVGNDWEIKASCFGLGDWFRHVKGVSVIGCVKRYDSPADPEFAHTSREVGIVDWTSHTDAYEAGKFLVYLIGEKTKVGSGKIVSVEEIKEMPAVI